MRLPPSVWALMPKRPTGRVTIFRPALQAARLRNRVRAGGGVHAAGRVALFLMCSKLRPPRPRCRNWPRGDGRHHGPFVVRISNVPNGPWAHRDRYRRLPSPPAAARQAPPESCDIQRSGIDRNPGRRRGRFRPRRGTRRGGAEPRPATRLSRPNSAAVHQTARTRIFLSQVGTASTWYPRCISQAGNPLMTRPRKLEDAPAETQRGDRSEAVMHIGLRSPAAQRGDDVLRQQLSLPHRVLGVGHRRGPGPFGRPGRALPRRRPRPQAPGTGAVAVPTRRSAPTISIPRSSMGRSVCGCAPIGFAALPTRPDDQF